MMQILHASFRELAPGDGTAAAAAAAAVEGGSSLTLELGAAEEGTPSSRATYRLMRHSNESPSLLDD